MAMQHNGTIVGVKIGHYSGFDWNLLNRQLNAAAHWADIQL